MARLGGRPATWPATVRTPPRSVCQSTRWHTTVRRVPVRCKDGSRARSRPRYPLHLENMGVLSDRLRDLIAQMEAADRRAAELTADHVAATRATLARMADDTPGDPIADAVALLTEHGWTVTPPTH